MAEKVFNIIGPKYGKKLVQEKAVRAFKHAAESRLMREFPDIQSTDQLISVSMASEDAFAKWCGLDDDQVEQIKEIVGRARVELPESRSKAIESMTALTNELWRRVLKPLTQEQRAKAEDLLGEPFPWLLAPGTKSWYGRDGKPVNLTRYGQEVKTAKTTDGRFAGEMTEQERKKIGIEQVDCIHYLMLRSNPVWVDVELEPEQLGEVLTSVKKRLDKYAMVRPMWGFGDVRLTQLLNSKHGKLPARVEELLSEDQKRRFFQIELQARLSKKHRRSFGLLNPAIIKALGMNSAVVREVQQVVDEVNAEIDEETKKLTISLESVTKL